MNYFKLSALALVLPGSLTAAYAQDNPLSVGASVLYYQSPYKGGQDRYLPVPIINYEGDNFYFRSLQAGYYLWKDKQDQLSLTVLGGPQHYDPDENDRGDMKRLDKRHMTLLGGLAYRHVADWGIVRTTLAGDVLNNSNGILWDLAYLYRFDFGDFSLTPGIGALWNSANQNRYYYGVSSREMERTGIDRYRPDDSWSPYVEMSADYKINESWRASLVGRYTRLGDEIKDSPMVDNNSQLTVWTGVSYTF
ncbi:MltA-interacting protein MipA [Paramixta manurensis]|uniref:MltA-interacting protein MipA n=1 Tax=Paramixta manurensis TaxID=2740817 RepID=A0A6M8U9F3_9GAMM|nr:MltA-interacting protein MipA [Erwiniaceae bacterium PD-1]